MPISRAQTFEEYQRDYLRSIQDPESFWFEEGKRLRWIAPYSRAKNTNLDLESCSIKWYEGGQINVSDNCLDRHLPEKANQPAIIWEGDNPAESKSITYGDLHTQVCTFANALKSMGVTKGDRVVLYLPMIIEAAVAMLACTRIGAIHSVVFGGFSPESLASRISDCQPRVVITSDFGLRGGKKLPFKANVDTALTMPNTQCVEGVIVVKRVGDAIDWKAGRDQWFGDLMDAASSDCPVIPMDAEDPLFILYTSGSTGKPKGVLHTTGGYLVFATMTFDHIFRYNPGEIYWCTADIGWITGHTYIVYGPLACGATTLMFEGVPNYPTNERFWQVVDKHKVNILYTAPTAIRSLIRAGDENLDSTSRQTLRLLGSVGEPIDPTSWQWYSDKVGLGKCPIVDTWWQTETGGILISPLPNAFPTKPGSATLPFYGVKLEILDTEGVPLDGEASGNLVLTDAWPGMARTLWNDHNRFLETYFSTYKGKYFTGDGSHRDTDGYYWITGRVDDVINVSGHRIGTAEIESALDAHECVVESAVVGFPHDIKGQGIYAYVILDPHHNSASPEKELVKWVRDRIGPIATIDHIQITDNLPKTRSGKVMRRILRKVAAGETDNFGDTSTLLDPSVVEKLVVGRLG